MRARDDLPSVCMSLRCGQQDREVEQKGPPVRIAFDDDGNATAAAEAFAKKCGVGIADLERQQTAKGEWLCYRSHVAGKTAAELLPGCIEEALAALPIPRRMRWGAHEVEFCAARALDSAVTRQAEN